MESAGSALKRMVPELVVSKQKLRQAEGSCIVPLKREEGKQNLGFSSRPFVLCGVPVRKPAREEMLYERRNGNFVLQITGHPSYGLPFGQDRIVPIYLATLAIRQQSQTIREKLEDWLASIRVLWPECPARISPDGMSLIVNRASAVLGEKRFAVEKAYVEGTCL
jgi:hypothetical protein